MTIAKHKEYGVPGSLTANPVSTEWNEMVDRIQDAGSGLNTKHLTISDSGSGYIKFPELTTAERDALTAGSGMTIWNADNLATETYNGTSWASSSGATVFTGLSDTPSAYTGSALAGVRVNAGVDALEFYDIVDWTNSTENLETTGSITGGNLVTDGSIVVAKDMNIDFSGGTGSALFKYNSTTKKLEVWVGGNKKADWGN